MSEVLLLASIIGTGVSAINQSKAQKLEGNIRSQQLETNARIGELQAKDAESRGKKDSEEYKKKVKLLIGRQRASFAAQGIDPGTGSALDIQLETAEFGAVDALTIRNNAFREATGHRIEAIDTRSQASFARFSGENRSRNTLITGGLTAARDLSAGTFKLKRG